MPATTAPPTTMADAVTAYHAYVAERLGELRAHVTALKAQIGNADTDAARATWLAAQQTWQRVGAAYGSFGDLGNGIAPGSRGLEGGAASPDFTGLRRIEYGLWHGQTPGELMPVVGKLLTDLDALEAHLPETAVEPADMPLRLHEILEDSVRDHLSGLGDQGSGMALALTSADVDATQEVLGLLRGLLEGRRKGYPAAVDAQLRQLSAAVDAARSPSGEWVPYRDVPLEQRQHVNGAIGRALESLALAPALFSTD